MRQAKGESSAFMEPNPPPKQTDNLVAAIARLFDPAKDRPILLLFTFLTAVAVVLFSVVAWRIDHMGGA